MRRRNITWVWLLGAAFMVGCGKQVPEDIIQPDRMENILYDYHLSISMGNNLSYSDNYQKAVSYTHLTLPTTSRV